MRQFVLNVNDSGVPTVGGEVGVVPVPPAAPKLLEMRGTNLTGGATDWRSWPADGPMEGTHYKFVSDAEIDSLIGMGCNTFRLLFTWEAVWPGLAQQLPTNQSYSPFPRHEAYCNRLWAIVERITRAGRICILDIHGDVDSGFAAYRGEIIGTGNYVGVLLAKLWGQIALKYKDNPFVHYGVTNEPHNMDAKTWFSVAQLVIDSIRSNSDSRIWMPGTNWTGAGTWMESNAPFWSLKDPAKNLGVQLHLYVDPNAGGGTDAIASETIIKTRLERAVGWARGMELPIILGEIGLSAVRDHLGVCWKSGHDFMLANRDVVKGFCWWASGPAEWWSTYRFQLAAGNPQAELLRGYLKGG